MVPCFLNTSRQQCYDTLTGTREGVGCSSTDGVMELADKELLQLFLGFLFSYGNTAHKWVDDVEGGVTRVVSADGTYIGCTLALELSDMQLCDGLEFVLSRDALQDKVVVTAHRDDVTLEGPTILVYSIIKQLVVFMQEIYEFPPKDFSTIRILPESAYSGSSGVLRVCVYGKFCRRPARATPSICWASTERWK